MSFKRFVAAASVALASLFVVSAFAQAPAPPTAPKMDSKPAKTATSGKKTPPRDPKTGKFVKADAGKTTTAKSTKTTAKSAKKTPARDPKTGQFVKSDAKMATPAPAKKTPARDPKTGQFVKATPKP